MHTSQVLHSILPIFNWKWWQVFVAVFVADWLIQGILQYRDSKKFKFRYWKPGLYGDLFLPFGVASSVYITQKVHNPHAWYLSLAWGVAVFFSGVLIHTYIRFYLLFIKLKRVTGEKQTALSTNWHTVVLILLFYIVGMTIIPMIVIHRPTWTVLLAIVGYGGWAVTFGYDMFHPKGAVRRQRD